MTSFAVKITFLGLAAQNALAAPSEDLYRRQSNSYDYVIVGGGTGGLAVAERLSEKADLTVAVIEAGGQYQVSNPLLSSTPAGDVYWCGSDPSDTNSNVDWNFITTPQAGAANRKIHYARGKCLGGSSARNFMIYQRGTVGSYQRWADEVGDQSYTWENLQPYFMKSPHFTPPNTTLRAANATTEYNSAAFSSSGGPLEVSYANYAGPFSSWMQGSFNEIGIKTTQDFNSGSLMGCQYCSSTIDPSNENRDSSQTAYIPDLNARSNLHIYQNTVAQKILFDSSKKATGVAIPNGFGGLQNITATNEVILSAGAFQSPQLLMLSGIGPAETLNKFGIPVISALPGVGQNMWDHVFYGPSYRVNVQTFTKLANDVGYVLGQYGQYIAQKSGPLTNPVCDFLGWEKAPDSLRSSFSQSTLDDLATLPSDWPEIEFLSGPGYIGDFASLPDGQPKDGFQYATILGAVVAPFSRGNVTINSTNASDLPIVNPNWLTSKTDQEVAVAAFKRTRAAFQSQYMSGVLVNKTEYFPGPQVQSDEEILELIQKIVMTVWHAACTCKMGNSSDPNAVVDNRARVFGVTGLRVVDASSFALLPPGHPQSTIYMLAEKISEDILKS